MSVNASIEIKFYEIKPIDIVVLLLKAGWVFNDNGLQSYIPVGDEDEWDWKWEELTDEQMLFILKTKQDLNEIIGVGITWSDSNVGGELLLTQNSLIFSLSNNRLIGDSSVTDFNWYLDKIVNVLKLNKIKISSIKCEEFI